MNTGKFTLSIVTVLLSLSFIHSSLASGADSQTKEKIDYLVSELQRKHLDTSKFLTTIKELIKTSDANQYLKQQLITILTTSPATGSRMRAAWLLGEIRSKTAIPHLIKAEKDRHKWVRNAAKQALVSIRSGSR